MGTEKIPIEKDVALLRYPCKLLWEISSLVEGGGKLLVVGPKKKKSKTLLSKSYHMKEGSVLLILDEGDIFLAELLHKLLYYIYPMAQGRLLACSTCFMEQGPLIVRALQIRDRIEPLYGSRRACHGWLIDSCIG